MKRYITLTAAGATLAAVAIAATIVADPPEEVAGTPVAAPVLPSPEPYADEDGVIHVPGPTTVVHHPGPGDPECLALEAKKAAARESGGSPYIVIPTELLHCDPHTFR